MRGIHCILVDIEDARLERAAKLGARTVNSRRQDLEKIVMQETAGYGVTLVVDGAGAPGILEQAVKLAGPTGRIVVMNFAPGTSAIPQQEITKKELSLLGSRLNRRLIPQVLEWLAAGALESDALVTHEFKFDRALEAMELLERHPERACKVHLLF
jgi:L-gulonate 5-dehydrogenase